MKTILVVEDDEAFAYAASRSLETAGYNVVRVADSLAGLKAVEKTPVDLILADVRMPRGAPHGFAFGRVVHNRLRALPIVYMTAYPELAEEDAAPVLRKSDGVDAIVAAVRAQLAAD